MIFGRAGSGKTHYVRRLLCESAKSGTDGLCLIVPDQYSFESERAILNMLGASDARSVEVLGFSRLSDVVFKLFGGRSLPEIDLGTKAVMMRLALEETSDNLDLYRKNSLADEFVTTMLDTVEELKSARITPDDLKTLSLETDDALLSKKLSEIALIYAAFELQVNREYFDPSDKLELLYDKIEQNGYFAGKTVVFDSFFHFSEQQMRIVELAVKQAKETVMTFCCNGFDDSTPMLSSIRKSALRLVTFANQNGVKVAEPVVLEKSRRFASLELSAVEEGIFRPEYKKYTKSKGDVILCECATRYEEADYIARTILNLTRENGYRFRDFAIISRSDEICKNTVDITLEKYGIPFFADRRVPLKYQPLIRMVTAALRCCINLNSERLFTYLKTGLAGVDIEDISLLENYAFTWSISPEMWLSDFDMNPDGFVEGFNEHQTQILKRINEIRNIAVTPLVYLKNSLLAAKDGSDISRAIYMFLEKNQVSLRLRALAADVSEEEIYSKVWDELISLLDCLAAVTHHRPTDIKKYLSLFGLCVAAKTIGNIPQHIDEVSIGNAERMRPASPKVVFLMGANDKVFPRIGSLGGLLTDSDRTVLIERGFEVNDRGIKEMNNELSLAYNAACAPSEKLYVCWARNDTDGKKLYPSKIVTDIKRILPECICYEEKQYLNESGLSSAEPIVSSTPALEIQALTLNRPSTFSHSLSKALTENADTKDLAESVLAFSKEKKEFLTKQSAQKMFGGDTTLSPTAIEAYFRCKFRYFCRYGLGIKTPVTAEMDSMNRGSLIHYCLEQLIGALGSEQLKTMTEKQITDTVTLLLNKYLDEVMGGEKNKSKRFMRNYKMTLQLVKQLAVFIAGEFSAGRFVASHCELEIGDGVSAKVRPIRIKNPDGTTVCVRGFVDRVDVCKDQEKTFIRVIDYKSSSKTLSPTTIYNGMNLQMPLYLFTLCKNGEELFGKQRIPAAVLYMRVGDKVVTAPRNAVDADIREALNDGSRLDGLFLNDDEFIDAIDTHRKGEYIALKYKNGQPDTRKSGILSLETMGSIEHRIEELLLEMMSELKNGNINADPVDISKTDHGCKYCDYSAVCRVEKNTPHKTAIKVSNYNFEVKEEKSDG